MRGGFRRVLGCMLLVAGIAVLCLLACLYVVSSKMASVVEQVEPAPFEERGDVALPPANHDDAERVDWSYWQDVNPDVVAWIVVPGTNIDQPVVQARPADPDRYLAYDVYGNWNYHGCAYVDAGCDLGIGSPNVVICGHNLIDGTMFTQIEGYHDSQFAEGHRTIELYTPQGVRVYEVVGTDTVPGWQEIKRTTFADDGDFEAYARERIESCRISLGGFEPGDRLLTLYTCSYFENPGNERTIVYALYRG